MEVVRDKKDNCIIVCSIENLDPMGVHTGDSITVAPALTLTDKEYQIMRDASIAVLREIGVETGGSNVQFGINPADGRMVVIEMNPRVSPLLRARLEGHRLPHRQGRGAAGRRLHARRARERHHRRRDTRELRADDRLCRHQDPALRLREVPGRRQPADHLDEVGRRGHGHRPHLPGDRCRRRCARWRPVSPASTRSASPASASTTTRTRTPFAPPSRSPTPNRLLHVAEAMRLGMSVEDIYDACKIDTWFLEQITRHRRDREAGPRDRPAGRRARRCAMLKSMGFSDRRLAELSGKQAKDVRALRKSLERPPGLSSASTPARPSSPRPPPTCTRPTSRPSPALRPMRRGRLIARRS